MVRNRVPGLALKSFDMVMHVGLKQEALWLVPVRAVEFASLSHTTTNTHTHTHTHKHSVAFLQLLQED